MQRLIDADKLQIEIIKQIAHFKSKANTTSINQAKLAYSLTAKGLELAKVLIDNAPIEEPCYQNTSCLDCKNYDKENHNCPRYCEVIKDAIKSRPQGKWGYNTDGKFMHFMGEWRYMTGGAYKCSLCRTITSAQYSYCPYCGADMRPKDGTQ